MAIHPLAGKPAPADILIDVAAVEKAYYERQPDVDNPLQLVNPFAPPEYGSGYDNVVRDPIDGQGTGISALSIEH